MMPDREASLWNLQTLFLSDFPYSGFPHVTTEHARLEKFCGASWKLYEPQMSKQARKVVTRAICRIICPIKKALLSIS